MVSREAVLKPVVFALSALIFLLLPFRPLALAQEPPPAVESPQLPAQEGVVAPEAHAGHEPPVYWITFFALLLLSIAVFPLVKEEWWEHNLHKGYVVAILGLPVLIYYLVLSPMALVHSFEEYFSFIVLLWALFTISGGIVLRGDLKATPLVNTSFLAIGCVIANIFGTTGAAMLLIRPVLRTNEERQRKKHIVIFFTFLVANIGGCLTPLGDPPLFLGFLRGVPFTWTLKLFPMWLFEVTLLLIIFFIMDTWQYRKERPEDIRSDIAQQVPLSIDGKLNFILIAGVMLAVLLSSTIHGTFLALNIPQWGEGSPWREIIMITMGLLSMRFTAKRLRLDNNFSFAAIIEVAVLFVGIFVTMIPALDLLRIHGDELGVNQPWQYMWATGLLSSFLDNAPTYLVFASMGQGMADVTTMQGLIDKAEPILKAISIGAVFMGANTYIGNAPNFMVKVISDTAGNRKVTMPSFFGYMKWSGAILIPTFILVTLIFFR